ncbi:PEP-CTERM sorting domain-containing protein [Nostoc sp. TCL26-01]|uniref:PEP-CTERM sorting domain-containing protein n=1 Tax=Nostoc sp. TCL26-01 TaxID=2576904 RepID=UPI0015BB43CE|nr:PEP-CTERM sorting domain-containing protein [Nostoc sp. TCL26-01]QLE55436.1 PEP-CTERM sorting domain-containing protein [Nostoc sp. TCL26-01]
MKKIFRSFTLVSASFALSFASTGFNLAQAATVNYTFQTSIDSGSLLGNTYSGSLSYDDSSLVGSGSEFIDVSAVSFDFQGVNYTTANNPTVAFIDGNFLGLNFSPVPLFSFIANPDFAEAYFTYDLGNGNAGTGNVVYTLESTSIPESTNVLGLLGLGVWGMGYWLKRGVRAM